ncbi:MAG: ABC transporter permease [Phycisphaerales bacterium]|nr:ABC transporter permease [Phycisphaerae bacterium]NNF45049.1 ABC transporter permease [Phycisphaerales bacterium]NNM27472.1 ABC transporter permease [Phycisphaerales bacterium]
MSLRALDRKMLRDLINMRGQATAICLVMACGLATFVMSLVMLDSLERTLNAYYEGHRFPHVFAHMERAPMALRERIAAIPGVARVETRVVEQVTLDMPGLAEPAVGRLISIPERRRPELCRLYLRAGRYPERGGRREVLVSDAFADAHALRVGDRVRAILNGRLDELHVVGIALSPEYIYQIKPGDVLPDPLRFGVFWIPEPELAAAFDMEGAFNDVLCSLRAGGSAAEVITRLDRLIDPYGSLGAYDRDDQISHEFVTNEIRELKGTAVVAPIIFLFVAAFLLNVVISRLVTTQREQIAALKALGYGRREIGNHYLKLVGVILVVSVLLGGGAGLWMASGLTALYAQFFHFPVLEMHVEPRVLVLAAAVSGLAGYGATATAVRRAMRLPPAEAMRPAPPPVYRPTILERSGLQHLLSPAARMILRQLERRPLKAALSCLGIAMGAAVLVLGAFMEDAVDYAMELQFEVVQRHELTATFVDTRGPEALAEIRHLPGAGHVEPFRGVAVRLRAEHRSRRVGIMGLEPAGELFNVTDLDGKAIPLPDEGLVLSTKLGEILDVRVGDPVTVEVLEGKRAVRRMAVGALVSDFQGVSAYMNRRALNRVLDEGPRISGVFVDADPVAHATLFRRMKEMPMVAAVTLKDAALQSFRDTMGEMIMRMRAFNIGFAVIIAFGVVYNSARISLAERSRELATLRVIGFTRAEISMIQLGELAILTLLGIPLGLVIGFAFAWMTTNAFDTELFRIPLVVERSTYASAATVVLVAAAISGFVVRRMLDRLDLVAVLKSRE